MPRQKIRLVIDTGVFIPCGDKSKDKIDAIREFGNKLPELTEKFEIVILLSTEVLGEYKSIPARLKNPDCHPLPEFHRGFSRTLHQLLRRERLRRCLERQFGSYKIHVIESSKLNRYQVSEFVNDPDDEKFLRLALAEANRGYVYLLTVDSKSLLKLKEDSQLYAMLCKKYGEAKNVTVALPNELLEAIEGML
jgi:predicted nucleic acid-binding protein